MTTNTSQTSSLGSVSFLNIFGVLVSIVLCVLFIILGGHALKYMKEFACKIKIIVNRAEDKSVNLKDYNQKQVTKGQEKQRPESFQQLETIYHNEIKKSRSLQYCMVVKNLISKYDHIIYYPFRERLLDQYDLLKPKTSFYTLLVICTCCIAWMTTIFLSAILQNVYTNIDSVPLATFIELTVAIAIISSILNIIATNRLFRMYLLTLKSAFRVDYGHQYKDMAQALKEYEPENSDEEKELFKHQDQLRNYEIVEEDLDRENDQNMNHENNLMLQSEMMTQRGLIKRDDSYINTSRKLLAEDMDRSDKALLPGEHQNVKSQGYGLGNNLALSKGQDIGNGPNPGMMNHLTPNPDQFNNSQLGGNNSQNMSSVSKRRGRAIKDIFELQVVIDGAEDANADAKYIYIEDKHAMGDLDLLNNEALKGENRSNVMTFSVLFVIIAVASGVCCYLNYSFTSTLAQYVFYMFVGGFLGDIIISRPIILLIYALFRYCRAYGKGYRKVEYKSTKDVRQAYSSAIKDMFANRRKYREEQSKNRNEATGVADRGSFMTTNPLKALMDQKGDRSQDLMMDNYDHVTQNGDRHDTSTMKQALDFHDQEDQYAQEIIHKHDDDADGNKLSMNTLINRVNPTEFARPQIEDDQKNFEKTQNMTQYNTSIPLLSNLQQAIKAKELEKLEKVMDQKQLNNELVDYNLLLLRKIYDAYEERADKVLRNFRKDKRGVLRKRYMVPILNPNYDYEQLLQEMAAKGKQAKEDIEEDEVKLDGMTVCEDFEQQLMEAIQQEAQSDLYPQKVERQKIDRFGNPVDENKEDIKKAPLAPSFGLVELECEDNQVEDDENARRMQMLEDLKRRLANGEELTAEELALLEQLENERLQQLEVLINSLLKNGYDNLTDEEKLTLIGYQKEKCNIHLGQEERKKPRTEENEQRIEELTDELQRLEIQEMKLRQKLFGLSDEELDRLWKLEQERLDKMMQRIFELEEQGWENLPSKEKFELLSLKKSCLQIELDRINRKKPPLSEADLLRVNEIEEELKRLELQELLLKEQLGLLSDSEKARLSELRGFFEQLERDRELSELEALRKKLLDGTITDEELRRLRELEAKYGLDAIENPFEKQMQLNDEFDQNMQDEQIVEPDEQNIQEDQQLYQQEDDDDILHSRITDQDNFQDLPPVEVMNNPNQSPTKMLDDQQDQQLLDEANQNDQEQLNEVQQNDQIDDGNYQIQDGTNGLQGVDHDDDLSQIEKQNQLDDSNIDPTLLAMAQQNQDDFNELNQINQSQRLSDDDYERLLEKQRLGLLTPEEEELLRAHQELLDQEARQLQQQDQQLTDRQNLDDDLAFGRDDLEMDNAAAIAADGESIYSHKTSAILDEEKVSFMHIDHLQNEEVNSDESFAEQDMVYYDKDDLTRFSENRGINRVKRRQAPQYYSENDLQEVKEGDFSEGDSVSGRSAGGRSRRTMGRGYLSHNQLETQSHEDLIEGRVKVDAWNLNYQKKKKKQKKRKVTDNAKRKMRDLQDIYGVDAKTLANLKKGPLPRKQLAKKGKMTDDDFNQPPGSRMMSDNSFRTTMNTFAQNMQQTPAGRMHQSIADNQSNLFSFNGFGATRQNWGNGMRDSRFDKSSQKQGKESTNKKYPVTGMKKMTDTQQNFNSQKPNGQLTGRNISEYLDEESKSAQSASRSRGPSNNRFNISSGIGSNGGYGSVNNKKQGASQGKKGVKKGKKGPKKNQLMRQSDGMDSHTESDEAVDDRGAIFQKRNNFNDYYGQSPDSRGFRNGGMNDDLDHSESEEGNNQDIPSFQGNDFMFKQRGAVESKNKAKNSNTGAQGIKSTGQKGNLGLNSKLGGKSTAAAANSNNGLVKTQKRGDDRSASNNRNVGSRATRLSAGDDLSIEDLEAQSVQMRTGKKAQQSTKKKGTTHQRNGSAERVDSEEENDGGQVMFQRRNQRSDYSGLDLDRSANGRSKLDNSSSKPPLSNRKMRAGQNQNEDEEEEKGAYLGVSGNYKNVNKKPAQRNQSNAKGGKNTGLGQNNMSDNERLFRGTKYSNPLESDGDLMTGGKNKKNNLGGLGGSFGDQNMLGQINGRMSDQMNQNQRRRDRVNNNGGMNRGGSAEEEDEDDYIVGPESNHSSLKKRPFQGAQMSNSHQARDDNDEQYLLLQRERQIIEDIESERDYEGNGVLAKKRKIRKAAKSTNPRNAQQLRYQELQKERLRKLKQEAEGALFSQENDLEAGAVKQKKKKKAKRELVKKEINYWLDYDSPYAEYLVARFREWSPNPNVVNNPVNAKRNSMDRSKYSEVANVYQQSAANGRGSSKGNSRSRERDGRKSSLNTSASKFPKGGQGSQMRVGQGNVATQNPNFLNVNGANGGSLIQTRNQLFVDDFEEP